MSTLIIIVQLILIYTVHVLSSIDGLSYMDPINFRPLPQRDNPCNPLYWYPREIPAYCYEQNIKKPNIPLPPPRNLTDPAPPGTNISLPLPPPYFQPFVPIIPPPPPPPVMYPLLPPLYPGIHVFPGYPAVPNTGFSFPNILPGPSFSYPGFHYQNPGFVPGLPGLVSRDGGINVMPFTDAYSDLLSRYTNRMMIKKHEHYLKGRPWSRHRD